MVQVTPDIPVTQQNANSASAEEFKTRTQEIANDICRQAKKIDALIDSLPGVSVSKSDQEREFVELSKEDEAVTHELEEAGREARALLEEISGTLKEIADNAGKQTGSPNAATYKCFKLLRGGPEAIAPNADDANKRRDVVRGILKYWIVMAGFTAVELASDGAELTYDYIVEPYLIQNEEVLDGYLQHARTVAHRSTSTASKTVYDKWVGYMQQTINQSGYGASSDTSPQNTEHAGEGDQSNFTGLAGLLKTVSPRIPGTSTAANYISGLSGADNTQPSAGQPSITGNSPGITSMLTSWLASYASAPMAEMPDHKRLHDIRSRKQQLQDMVRQLETSENSILERSTNSSSTTTAAAASGSKGASANDASEFEDDAVMVNEPGAEETLEQRKHGASGLSKTDGSAVSNTTRSASSSTSRRWFW
ncbi:hypothetical protein EV177_000707 [Coemansia sp. RSA 1804]|nr:hypothetical protein EV177_000707 [Coemansia sp. RSA 1804]